MAVMSRFTTPSSAFLSFVNVFFDMLVYILFANIIFNYVPYVAGFSRDQLFIITGTSMIIEALSWFTFRSGVSGLPHHVQKGTIESAFVRPLPSQFLALFNRMDPEDSVRIFTALILIVPHAAAIAFPAALHIPLYIISLVAGLVIYFALLSSIASLSFFFGRMDGFYAVVASIIETSHYPFTIFSKKLQWIFMSILPTAFLGSIPTLVLTTNNHFYWTIVSIFVAMVSFYISTKIWHYTSSKYAGASG